MNLATKSQNPDFIPFDGFAEDIPESVEGPVTQKPSRFEKRTPTDRAETLYSEDCPKCRGTGWISAYSFREAGRCFKCDGKGVLTFKTPKAVRDANKLKAADRKERQLAANLAAVEALHPTLKEWWTNTTFNFAIDLREKAKAYGSLTSGQLAAAIRCADKFKATNLEREAQKATAVAAAPVVDISPITSAFDRAKKRGLKNPKMHLLGNDERLVFSLAKESSVNAGSVYVKASGGDDAGVYLGKITGGKFLKSRDCSDVQAKAVEVACVDPENAAIAYGKTFGICSVCSRELSDPDSVARGIGPICADRFF
jgi:hypothetical protein